MEITWFRVESGDARTGAVPFTPRRLLSPFSVLIPGQRTAARAQGRCGVLGSRLPDSSPRAHGVPHAALVLALSLAFAQTQAASGEARPRRPRHTAPSVPVPTLRRKHSSVALRCVRDPADRGCQFRAWAAAAGCVRARRGHASGRTLGRSGKCPPSVGLRVLCLHLQRGGVAPGWRERGWRPPPGPSAPGSLPGRLHQS